MKNIIRAPDFVRKNIAQLQQKRIDSDMTLKELQALSGVTSVTISSLEEGGHVPQRKTYNALAEIFGWQTWCINTKKINFPFRLTKQEHAEAIAKANSFGLCLTSFIRKLLAESPYGTEGK